MVGLVVDPIFADRRLAEIYDPLDPVRDDLDVYASIADELGARSVLDVGCGTGTFACLLAERGIDVVGVDPAGASLDVARRKQYGDRVTWVLGDATTLPRLQVDLATMTANVAQVFLTDDDWCATLRGVHASLKPGGHLVLETRAPDARAWLEWTRAQTHQRTDVPGIGVVETWCDVTSVDDDLVTFRWTHAFESDGTVLTSDSTLRFRSREAVEWSLSTSGFALDEVRDAPDRPGRELVFIASRHRSAAPSS
jgi:SAM-dependent methyltransferase